jgi:hypothetical protein
MPGMSVFGPGSFVVDNAVTTSVLCVSSNSDNVVIHAALQMCATVVWWRVWIATEWR